MIVALKAIALLKVTVHMNATVCTRAIVASKVTVQAKTTAVSQVGMARTRTPIIEPAIIRSGATEAELCSSSASEKILITRPPVRFRSPEIARDWIELRGSWTSFRGNWPGG